VAITTDHPVIPLQYLTLCASLAVKAGMDTDAAFRAITINPARILGIDNRVGSIKTGKDADMVLFDGSPLEIMTRVKQVFIDGKTIIKR
jgi:imidazolonepropionase-like amidohydrolase